LTDFLHIKTERLDNLLYALRAVSNVREGDAIYPIHASFRDFLMDRHSCTNPSVFVDPTRHHSMISRACFDRMTSSLQKPDLRNICRDRKKLLPDDLTYACQYWTRHLAESNLDQSLVDRLHDFASTRLLYWIEGLSLIDDLDLGISGLGIMIKVLVVGPRLHGCEHKAKYPTSSAPVKYPMRLPPYCLMPIGSWSISKTCLYLRCTPILLHSS